MVVYVIECRVCGKQYNGSTVTKFCARAYNYKNTHRNFQKEQKLSNQSPKHKRFHELFPQRDHNGICDWEITITDHAETEKSFRQKELYWYYKLKTYDPFDLMNVILTLNIRQRSLFIVWMYQIRIIVCFFPCKYYVCYKCFICCSCNCYNCYC